MEFIIVQRFAAERCNNLSLGPGCRSDPKCGGSFARPPTENNRHQVQRFIALQLCMCSHQRARRRCLIRIPASHAKFIPSGSINLLAALDCAPHTKGVGGESCGKKSQPPRLSQSFAYMLLWGGPRAQHIMSLSQMMERFVSRLTQRVDSIQTPLLISSWKFLDTYEKMRLKLTRRH